MKSHKYNQFPQYDEEGTSSKKRNWEQWHIYHLLLYKDIYTCKDGCLFYSPLQTICTMVMTATFFYKWWNSSAAPLWNSDAYPYECECSWVFLCVTFHQLVWYPTLLCSCHWPTPGAPDAFTSTAIERMAYVAIFPENIKLLTMKVLILKHSFAITFKAWKWPERPEGQKKEKLTFTEHLCSGILSGCFTYLVSYDMALATSH